MQTNSNIALRIFLYLLGLVFVSIFLVLFTVHTVLAQPGGAGDGGGNSSSGCPSTYSTCYGAAWVYQTTDSDKVPIRSLYESANGPFAIYAKGCKSSGGFFKYVLVNKQNSGQYRSWQIGPANGNSENRSMFFGGQTNYLIYSRKTDTLPSNLTNGKQYSWYAVQKAFNDAKRLGQASGYDWNGSSKLGWFCYTNDWSVSVNNERKHEPSERVPGGTLKYDYSVIQNGWGVTNKDVQYRTVIKRMPASYTEDKVPSVADVQTEKSIIKGSPSSGNKKIAAGWEPEVIDVKDNRDLEYTVQSTDAGRWICVYSYAYPESISSNNRNHMKKCDFIKGGWELGLQTASAVSPQNPNTKDFGSTYTTKNKTADVGQRVFFLSKVERKSDVAVPVEFKIKKQRKIQFADNRSISDCNAVRKGYYWDNNVRACIAQGKEASIKWTKDVNEDYYFDGEDERSFFGEAGVPARIGGMQICERIAVDPGMSGDTGWTYGNPWSCVDINYPPYELMPEISTNPDIAEPGVRVNIEGLVTNNGSYQSRDTEWQIRRLERAPGVAVPMDVKNSTVTPIEYFGSSSLVVSGKKIFPRNVTELWSGAETIPDKVVGTHICYTLSLKPFNDKTDDSWSHAISCVVLAKKPKIQVLGGDLIVGKGNTSKIATSTVRKTIGDETLTFGSWGEYAITASGRIYGMASGAGYSGGNTDNDFCKVSFLTITNAGSGKCTNSTPKGLYQYGSAVPSIASSFNEGVDLGRSPIIDVTSRANKGILKATGSVTVTAADNKDVPLGQWVVINAQEANITIDKDIKYYGGDISDIAMLPQLIIIGNNISINSDVKRVDAWLIASGKNGQINTCKDSDVSSFSDLNARRCTDQLVVNGPVVARQLFLYRTAGSGQLDQSAVPAEIFNLRADAYLWANYFSGTSNRLQTTSSTELPPRF